MFGASAFAQMYFAQGYPALPQYGRVTGTDSPYTTTHSADTTHGLITTTETAATVTGTDSLP